MNSHHRTPRGTADFDLYPYTPSDAAGYIFLVLFGIAAVAHIVWAVSMRTWYFIPFILGSIGEFSAPRAASRSACIVSAHTFLQVQQADTTDAHGPTASLATARPI